MPPEACKIDFAEVSVFREIFVNHNVAAFPTASGTHAPVYSRKSHKAHAFTRQTWKKHRHAYCRWQSALSPFRPTESLMQYPASAGLPRHEIKSEIQATPRWPPCEAPPPSGEVVVTNRQRPVRLATQTFCLLSALPCCKCRSKRHGQQLLTLSECTQKLSTYVKETNLTPK